DIPLSSTPGGLASGFGTVWVALDDGTVLRLDPATGAEVGKTVIGSALDDIVAGETGIWVTSDKGLHKIDPDSGEVVFTVLVGGTPQGLAPTAGGVVVAVTTPASTGLVQRVDDATRTVTDVAPLTAAANDLTVDGGVAWVAAADAKVHRVELATGAVQIVDAGGQVDGLAALDDSVWVTVPSANEVVRMAVNDGVVKRRITVDAGPNELTIAGGEVWVALTTTNKAAAIDIDTDAITHTIDVGDAPDRLVVVDDTIWVSNTGTPSVSVRPVAAR
ncbi:MAG TPA: hypothetical protein VF855_05840, partial [Acidimicrobiales bacterium]